MRKNRFPIIQKLSHYVVGFAILMEGISEAEDFAQYWPYVIIFCSIGILIFIFTFYEHRIEQRWIKIHPLIQIMESVVLFLIGILYVHRNKHWLPYVVFLAAVAYLTVGIVGFLKLRKKQKLNI
ncbi:MAG: hypothetical protein ABSB78_01035 [Bacteroidota bacterium]